jgi:molybdopterin molybdotransferase
MVTVNAAKILINEYASHSNVSDIYINDANGHILAEDLYAIIDTPPFDSSAMDGYAIIYNDEYYKKNWTVIGEVQAGASVNNALQTNEAFRIFTGAKIPAVANTVVVQEKVNRQGNIFTIEKHILEKGSNVRPQGSQLKKGELILTKNSKLNAASISLLANIGISKVKVYSKPKISIIVTGKELIQPGTPLPDGMIYESNSFALKAALNELQIQPSTITITDDIKEDIIEAIQSNLMQDIVILTGGVSVGDYDFVAASLEQCGVKEIFHKVKQKPGKPFYFGIKNKTLIFGLPGNPAAVLTCFYEYIVSAIETYTKHIYYKTDNLPLINSYTKKTGLTHFVKAKTDGKTVEILNSQESYLLNSFAYANCIVELPEEEEIFEEGNIVKLKMIANI